jgi:cytochrome c oxidase subunit IV
VSAPSHSEPKHHVVPVGVYLAVFAALMVLTLVTVWVAEHNFGALNTPVALGIAITKATLVVLFFMHVKYSPKLIWLVVVSAFLWLAILLGITLSDYYAPRMEPGATPSILRQ